MKKQNIFLAISTVLFISCAQTEQDKVGEAQACLDKARGAEAIQCMSKVEGINSKEANLIRCSAKFIEEGFGDPNRLTNAFKEIQNGSGATPTANFLSALAFKSNATASTNVSNAQASYDYCVASSSPGFVLFSGFSNVATILTNGSQSATVDLNGAVSNPAVIGATAVAMYNATCKSSDNTELSEICTSLNTAIGTNTDNSVIGNALIDCLNGTTPSCGL